MEIPIDLEITKDIESQIAFLSNKNWPWPFGPLGQTSYDTVDQKSDQNG